MALFGPKLFSHLQIIYFFGNPACDELFCKVLVPFSLEVEFYSTLLILSVLSDSVQIVFLNIKLDLRFSHRGKELILFSLSI